MFLTAIPMPILVPIPVTISKYVCGMAVERLGEILPLVVPLVLVLNWPPAVVPAIFVYYTHSTEMLCSSRPQ